MKAAVVNCSAPNYNLGAAKLSDWLRSRGDEVTEFAGDPGLFACGFDLVCLSVIFSWDAPIARDIAQRVQGQSDVWAGGPGLFALQAWWKEQTGLPAIVGVDERFDKQRGKYKMTFAIRGCNVGCSFCIVPKMEGLDFRLDPGFIPAPILGDNNLSATPVPWQELIIRRYKESGTPLLDANSGFEPATFDESTFARWSEINRGAWRFAFDEIGEAASVERMAWILRAVSGRRKRVYVLIGLEPIAACLERARKVIEWGCEPFVQIFRPLNWLEKGRYPNPRYDWGTSKLQRDFQRYFNSPQVWRSTPIENYISTGGGRPFAHLAPKFVA